MTKDNPGCYHSLIEYLHETTGICITKEITINKIEHLYTNGKKKKLVYKSDNIVVIGEDGKRYAYMQAFGKRTIDSITPAYFIVTMNRGIAEFGLTIIPCGNYRDSLGDGWYSNVPLVKVNDKYFAPNMECAH